MKSYLDLLKYVLDNGERTTNRTGIDTIAVSGYHLKHDMREGFPLLTTKKMGIKSILAELEFFINGYTDKQWLKDRKCFIWNEWCNPKKVPYSNDEETKQKMTEENDLGKIYGYQWRNFDGDESFKGTDQLKTLIDNIKKDPTSRRLIVTAWNPNQLDEMALPPCHLGFEVLCYPESGYMDLIYAMRSNDLFLGAPYNIASYAALLELLCKETGFKPRYLEAMLGNCHIYTNHLAQVEEQLSREPYQLPNLSFKKFTSIFDWHYNDCEIMNYQSHPKISAEVAV